MGSLKRSRILRMILLWTAAVVLSFLLLTLLFEHIWGKRDQSGLYNRCRLIVTGAGQLYTETSQMSEDVSDKLYKVAFRQMALLSWAALEGSRSEKTLLSLQEMAEQHNITYLAVRSGNSCIEIQSSPEDRSYGELDAYLKKNGEYTDDYRWIILEEDDQIFAGCSMNSRGDAMIGCVSVPSGGLFSEITFSADRFLEQYSLSKGASLLVINNESGLIEGVKGDVGLEPGEQMGEIAQDNSITINAVRYIAYKDDMGDYSFCALIPVVSSVPGQIVPPYIPAVFYAVLLLLAILYMWFLRSDILEGRIRIRDEEAAKGGTFAGVLIRRGRMMFLGASLCVMIAVVLYCSLAVTDYIRMYMNVIIDGANNNFIGIRHAEESKRDAYLANELITADMFADITAMEPALCDSDKLRTLHRATGYDFFLIDREQRVDAASLLSYDLTGLMEEGAELSGLLPVLEGRADRIAVSVPAGGLSYNYYAVRRRDKEGMALVRDDSDGKVTFENLIMSYPLLPQMIMLAIDGDSRQVLSASIPGVIGMDVHDIGLTEKQLTDDFTGNLMVNGTPYFMVSDNDGEMLTCIATTISWLFERYAPLVLLTILAGFLVTLFFFILIYIAQKDIWADLPDRSEISYPEEEGDIYGSDEAYYGDILGRLSVLIPADARWGQNPMLFKIHFAAEKLKRVLYLLLLAAGVFFMILMRSKNGADPTYSTLRFLTARRWDYGLNIFAIVYALGVILVIYTVTLILRKTVLLIGVNFGTKGETLARLLDSFLNYASAIGACMYSMLYLGVNTTALIASAGIVGLGLSLGAKDLVTDILAGVSIVFEGEFRTGDIVEIGGYRGMVQEIGIRTVKITADGNVKIFRNSSVSGVINLTQRYSLATVRIQVSRQERIDRVEEIFKKALPSIKEQIPRIEGDIRFLGVCDMNADSVILEITARCEERYRSQVERDLYRHINLLMAEQGLKARG